MYNSHEGENFIPPGLANATDVGTPAFNSSLASFNNWLSGYLPGFSQDDLDKVKELYPEVGSTETITSYNDTYTRAGLIFRDSVLACPGYWMATAASKGSYLGEYSIAPAKHASDTGWVRFPSPPLLPLSVKPVRINADATCCCCSGTQSAPSSRPSLTSTTATRARSPHSS